MKPLIFNLLLASLNLVANTSYANDYTNQPNDLVKQKTALYKDCELKINLAYKTHHAKGINYSGNPPKKLTYIEGANRFSSTAKQASSFKPALAHKYAINSFGCGTECIGTVLVDLQSGVAFLGPIYATDIKTNIQSNVIVTDHEVLKDYLSNHWAKPVSVWVVKNKHVEKLFTCRLDALNEH